MRPLRRTDLALAYQYFARLSDQSKYMRFMVQTPALTEETLDSVLGALGDERAAIVVASVDRSRDEEVVGGGRLVPTDRHGTCEFALSVVDEWHGRGVGTAILREIVRLARVLKYHHVEGMVLSVNTKMLKVAMGLKFHAHADPRDPSITIVSRSITG